MGFLSEFLKGLSKTEHSQPTCVMSNAPGEAGINPGTWALLQTWHLLGAISPHDVPSAGPATSPALQRLGNHLSSVVISKDI